MLKAEERPAQPKAPRGSSVGRWRIATVTSIVALVVVSGTLGYFVGTHPATSGPKFVVLYSGTVLSNPPIITTNCAPYDYALKLFAPSCNATQASVVFGIDSTSSNLFGPNSLLVSLNVTAGPACIVAFGGPPPSLCRYMLELVSPVTSPPMGAQPPTANVTVYLVNESQTWVFPASVYGAQLTLRYINFGPVTQFTANLKVQLEVR